jgi:hypothetical protein
MAQSNEPTAAAAMYPNLPHGTPSEVEQRRTSSIASAMWPRPEPRPLSHHELKEAWRDRMMSLAGLRRR